MQRIDENLKFEVVNEMANHVWPFVTPLSKSLSSDRGMALGTGNYIEFEGNAFLMTNCHVVEAAIGANLGHLPNHHDEYVAVNTAITAPWPIDLAVAPISKSLLGDSQSAIPLERFDQYFRPVQGEWLFFLGFPGTTATRHQPQLPSNTRVSWFGSLPTIGIPIVTQQVEQLPPGLPHYDATTHVAVHFPASAPKSPGSQPKDLPNPHGMSGSLLWDTKYVAARQAGGDWTPNMARVCGLVWAAHPTPEVVVATIVDHFLPELREMLNGMQTTELG